MTADDRNILRDVADALEAGNASPLERASLANAVRLIVAIDQAAQTKAMDVRREALEEAAKVCRAVRSEFRSKEFPGDVGDEAAECATAIRALRDAPNA